MTSGEVLMFPNWKKGLTALLAPLTTLMVPSSWFHT